MFMKDICKMIYKMLGFTCYRVDYKPFIREILKEEKKMHPEDANCAEDCAAVIAELAYANEACAPKPGARDVLIENVIPQYNNVGDKTVYVQYAYVHKGNTYHWGLTYKLGDKKLNRLFPNGRILSSDIGRIVKVEIQYCDSKNGEYPSIIDLDD